MTISHCNASARIVGAIVAFVLLTAFAAPARAANPKPVDVVPLEQLREAHYARVGISGRSYVLFRPQPMSGGLAFERVELPHRAAIVTVVYRDSVLPLPNPIPWSSIEQLESGVSTRRTCVTAGGLLGFAAGAAWGGTWAYYDEFYNGTSPWLTTLTSAAIGAAAGAGIGLLLSSTKWTQLYPDPVERTQR
jgi:hypothetical protein